MSSWYPYAPQLDLHVKGRISSEDAQRQMNTAREILHRLAERPGIVLADEVGMGKTFVALAVAVSAALADTQGRPVVVMVPPALQEKWPADFALLCEKCLPEKLAARMRSASATDAEAFLKLLDDPRRRRSSVIFLTHGAMSRGLSDTWVKLALIQRALYRRHKVDGLRTSLCRVMGGLLRAGWVERKDPDLWSALLHKPPVDWLEIMRNRGFDPERRDDPESADDPVPRAVVNALAKLKRQDTDELFDVLDRTVPRRKSKYFDDHLKEARKQITVELHDIWGRCIEDLRLKLPLLILDEAHHLKNANTRLASLFSTTEAQQDADHIASGPLANVFDRMLFLTATPFQLGHHELCSILDRFDGVRWRALSAPTIGRQGYADGVEALRKSLDQAQQAAVGLDRAWGKLGPDDVRLGDTPAPDAAAWWANRPPAEHLTAPARHAVESYEHTRRRMRSAEDKLRPWVLRHLKARHLPGENTDIPRRRRLTGRAITSDTDGVGNTGLGATGPALLPFLLAARATACTPQSRPVFAEGLASSFEAFWHTRRQNSDPHDAGESPTDTDEKAASIPAPDVRAQWYLGQLERVLPVSQQATEPTHPKISATVRRAIETWRRGEKMVVFCHYVQTGRVLRRWISKGIGDAIRNDAAHKMGREPADAQQQLELLGQRFFDEDSPIRRACDQAIRSLLHAYPLLHGNEREWLEIVRRNLRTPAFLVRYFPVDQPQFDADAMAMALDQPDDSGLTLRQLLNHFFNFLQVRCGEQERERYRRAMRSIQTGSHFGRNATAAFADDELQGDRAEELLPNLRLINGATRQETRQRLMLAFNSPFYPEILVASSVMAEGVDLHVSCRQVIHHDLSWNPSTLEQRTGRVDRIGAKGERCGQPIHVYLPYVAETQDEKMFRVVTDRERWFNVVMGEEYALDVATTDRLATQIPLPQALADELAFRLSVAARPRDA